MWTLALLLLMLALAASWPSATPGPTDEVQAAQAKPAEKRASSSMLAQSGYAMSKDKLD